MKHHILLFLLCASICFFSSCNKPDDDDDKDIKTTGFCYSPKSDAGSYQDLKNANQAKFINAGGWSLGTIDLGFNFDFCGTAFSKLYCQYDDAFCTFTLDTSQGLTDLSGYEIHPYMAMFLESNSSSNLSYEVSGSSGNKVCKVQFDSLYLDNWSGDVSGYVSLQVWFYENGGKIEMHYGPNSVGPTAPTGIYNNKGPIVGVLGKSLSASIFASGDPASVKSTKTNSQSLSALPSSGDIIVFE